MDEGQSPIVNKELLFAQIGFSDYESAQYAVKLNTEGTGKVYVLFSDETSAKGYAEKYLASKIKIDGEKYIYDGAEYDTEREAIQAIRADVDDIVERYYFDGTDSSTYVSVLYDDMFFMDNDTGEEISQESRN